MILHIADITIAFNCTLTLPVLWIKSRLFEECIEMEGEICLKLLEFYKDFWTRGTPQLDDSWIEDYMSNQQIEMVPHVQNSLGLIDYRDFSRSRRLQTILLPSPHHINPHFSPFSKSAAPATPLNTFILQAINQARTSIYIQTPNLTSRPLTRTLISALKRGVSITIITSQNLMILEQLVTAFTTTSIELWKLRRAGCRLHSYYLTTTTNDPEAQHPKPGDLWLQYYTPRVYGGGGQEEPVKSHLKLLIVDDEIAVLGSGNMDRASWFTSQELGVAVVDGEFAKAVGECTHSGLKDRVHWVLNT